MTEEDARMEPRVKETGEPTAADKGQGGQRSLRVVAIDDEPSMPDFYRVASAALGVFLECADDPARGCFPHGTPD